MIAMTADGTLLADWITAWYGGTAAFRRCHCRKKNGSVGSDRGTIGDAVRVAKHVPRRDALLRSAREGRARA